MNHFLLLSEVLYSNVEEIDKIRGACAAQYFLMLHIFCFSKCASTSLLGEVLARSVR